MNPREQYRRFVRREPGVPPPNIDHGPLLAAYERWQGEGLSPDLDPRDYDAWCEAFGLDRYPLRLSYAPPRTPLFETDVLEETETTVTTRRADGSVIQDNKGSHKTIPHEVRPAVRDRDEWERYKAWMDVDAPLPGPDDPVAAAVAGRARAAGHPVWIDAGSLAGRPRDLLGFNVFAMMAYDDPAWLEDMIETHARAAERQVRIFGERGAPAEGVHFWEDICFKNGPIMNPAHFRELVVPRYRRVADLARGYGYDVVSVDSDGDIRPLLDAWLDGGVKLFWPLEAQAGVDVNELQARYGERALWWGNIHKHRLTGGPGAIRAELERVRPAVERGGYFPTLDHCCPMDVSFDNYLAYLRLRHEVLGLGRGGPDLARVKA